MFPRLITAQIEHALRYSLITLLIGPRRAGKTTLVRHMAHRDRRYITLDDDTARHVARKDPVGFIRGMDTVIIDEIQRALELLLPIKRSVDEDERYGRFLLTGSANILTLPQAADSLAGRMQIITLLPLARCEILGRSSHFLEQLFLGRLQPSQDPLLGDDLIQVMLRGGFPEAVKYDHDKAQTAWAHGYLTSILTKDLRDLGAIEKLTEFPRFFRTLAAYSGQLVNHSKLGNSIGISYRTVRRYLDGASAASLSDHSAPTLVYQRHQTPRQNTKTPFS